MKSFFWVVLAVGSWLFGGGCATPVENVNQGANNSGQAVGSIMRIPNSFTEGAASGVAGQTSPNPYNR